jgi:hypothetical protein
LTREREKKIQPDLPNGTGAARFFSVQHTKLEKYTKPSENIPVGYKIHQKNPDLPDGTSVARFFFVQHTKPGKSSKITRNYTNRL